MKYMCVQPATLYYAWQVEVMINNFIKNGISPEDIQILCSNNGGISSEWEKMKQHYTDVNFHFYTDTGSPRRYIVPLRDNILSQHFKQFPELQEETIFFHDCDMVFTQPVNFDKFMNDDVWYLSDTVSYIGSKYIKSKGFGIYEKMCEIVGIDPSIPEKNQLNSGGAQHIMKNVKPSYWDKVESDSEKLYDYFSEHLKEHPKTEEYWPIQMWTADMWSLLWNMWYFGYDVKVHEDLHFVWPGNSSDDLKKHFIYHNSGVLSEGKDKLFFKGQYVNKLPYDIVNFVDESKSSHFYLNEIIETGKNSCFI